MQRYVLFRIGQSLIAMLGVSMLVFALTRLSGSIVDLYLPIEATPEDFERMTKYWGLDKPLYHQYMLYMWKLVQGDWGESWKWQQPALQVVLNKFPNTLQISVFTFFISTALGIFMGVFTAIKKDTGWDYVGKVVALMGQALPSFWQAIMLMWVFAVVLGWLPTSGKGEWYEWKYYILPSITLGSWNVAALMRITRSTMLDVLDSEYVKMARIKGLPEWKVTWKHCLRNAAIAPLTLFGGLAAGLLTGSVITETVFAWPGVGFVAIQAVNARDYAVVQAATIFFSAILIFAYLLVDILYAYLDPRIRYD
jgi:peptide/nickel transport system permease protein